MIAAEWFTACYRNIAPFAVLAAALIHPMSLQAQAWLPEEGSFSTSLTYNDTFNKKHYLPNGDEIDAGHTRTRSIGAVLSYSPTDRLMLSAGIPYVRSSYQGDHPHPGEIDNGDYHSTFTDLRLELHYQAMLEPLALAPYVAVVAPVTDYETMGHSAPGRGLEEYWVGFYAGKSLDLWLPRTYVQLRYNYAFVEEVAGVAHDRSNADLEIGYFLNPSWSVRVLGSWADTHGGIDIPVPPTDPLFPYHDQLAAESFFNVGAGVGWSFAPGASLYSIYMTSVEGQNGHKLDQGLTVGLGYSFY